MVQNARSPGPLTEPDYLLAGQQELQQSDRIRNCAELRTSIINGYAAVDFASNYLNVGGYGNSTYPYTLVVVAYMTDTSAYRMLLGSSDSGGLNWRTNISTGYLNSDKANVSNIGTGNMAVPNAQFSVLIYVVTSTTYADHINGTAAGNGSHSETLTAAKTFTLGGDASAQRTRGVATSLKSESTMPTRHPT